MSQDKIVFKTVCFACGNAMRVSFLNNNPKGKRKRCVYCGKSFSIYSNVNSHRLRNV